jgi:hypothetical protein
MPKKLRPAVDFMAFKCCMLKVKVFEFVSIVLEVINSALFVKEHLKSAATT